MTTPLKNSHKINDFSILVFDTNIFLLGLDFNVLKGVVYTSPKILGEIKKGDKNRNILAKIEAAIESHKLNVHVPSEKYLKIIKSKSKTTGDYKALSSADVEVLALALDLIDTSKESVLLCTNDYSMQNLSTELEIQFLSLLKEGIKNKIIWEVYCPFCKKSFPPEQLNSPCEKCGSKLKRRPKR